MTQERKRKPPAGDFLPLAPAEFYALLALADGNKHGYAILKDVTQRTQGKIRLSSSTLYDVIQRLESKGLIAESDRRPDPALDDERRRYYRLTELGRRVGLAEAERMEEALEAVRSRHYFRKPSPA